ncbi:uncharacterized protein LOC143803691 [Ranitomeya variabilis]|uniref:uncharacterized protein LOC143803691 n=1 Tax=Ranitomeya variabilis TaxID=490064 RepID=UPI0040566BED
MSNRVEFIREFLEIYRSFPCLWKIKSPEYSNREKRKAGYSKLIELYNLQAPEEQATENVVKKKIQALRTVWRKELNKVLQSSKSGSSTEEVYVPKLWYFEYLNFLRDQEVPRSSSCLRLLAPVEPTVPQNHVELDSQGQPEESAQDSGQDSAQDNAQDCSTSEIVEVAPARSQWRQGSRKRKATSDVSHELLSMAKKVLTRKTSPALEAFGLYITDKLSTMETRQRTLTERLIFEAVIALIQTFNVYGIRADLPRCGRKKNIHDTLKKQIIPMVTKEPRATSKKIRGIIQDQGYNEISRLSRYSGANCAAKYQETLYESDIVDPPTG